MFYSITGEVLHTSVNLAVIEAGGVGYACQTSTTSLGRIRKGARATLYTHLYVREDTVELFGFAALEELSAFRMLLGVSGVGPKAALAILSVHTPERLALALISGDEKALTAAAGVGKKLAQRVILELKDKMGAPDLRPGEDSTGYAPVPAGSLSEAQAALTVLGYTPLEAAAALKGLDGALPTEEIIRAALAKQLRHVNLI